MTAPKQSARADVRALATPLLSLASEPYYHATGEEVAVFEAAAGRCLPVMLKGPTGCGKTRFVEHMAWRLKRPLVTVACHDDLTTSDLVGRYLIVGDETVWMDGPLTAAVRAGAICYLDEIVEARKDTSVVIQAPPALSSVKPSNRLDSSKATMFSRGPSEPSAWMG